MSEKSEAMVTLTSSEQDSEESDPQAATTGDIEDLIITDNSDLGVYEAASDGQTIAGIVYKKTGNHVTLLATSVFPEYRGKGVAGRLLAGVLDKIRTQNETVTVSCPFATAFVNAHPEYSDIVMPTTGGRGVERRTH